MKLKVTPSAKGAYCTASGKTVALEPSEHGANYADEEAAAQTFKLTPRDLFFARKQALSALALAAELPVVVQGITMGTGADTQLQLNNLVTLLGLAKDSQPDEASRAAFMSLMVSGLVGPVTDHKESEHDMSVSEAFGFVVLYGQAVGQQRRNTLLKKAAILAAGSVATLESIPELQP